jgi:hypothetical protein
MLVAKIGIAKKPKDGKCLIPLNEIKKNIKRIKLLSKVVSNLLRKAESLVTFAAIETVTNVIRLRNKKRDIILKKLKFGFI